MNRFGQYPFVRIVFPFVFGILAEIRLDTPDFLTGILFLTLFFFYLTDFLTKNYFGNYTWRFINGGVLFLLLFMAGNYWAGFFDERKDPAHYVHLEEKERLYLAEIIREPVEKEKSVKMEVRVLEYVEGDKKSPVKGKLILYLKKEKHSLGLKYGDRLFFKGKINEIKAPANPGEFHYKKYAAYHHLYGQSYADEFHWQKAGEGGSFIFKMASYSRKKLLGVLQDAGLEGREFAVAAALLLGYADEIDKPTKSAYSASGALHVLSVSGLHVAIIFLVFDKLFVFLLSFRNGKYYKAALILILLWSYAMITGLSPSVNRSATMLSFIVIGKLINRNASIYNSVCASAFLILCVDPLILMDAGFQLSYMAVLGIIFLHPKIYNLFFFQSRWLDFIWNITAVSIAAQLITFPLGLYYFHQFPNYFLLSNLAVIPLGTIILYLGVAALVFYALPYLGDFLFFLLKWSVKLLNESVFFVEQLPGSITSGVVITVVEVLLIYFSLLVFFIYTESRRVIWLKFSVLSTSLLFISFSYTKWQQNHQEKITIYSIRKHTAIEFTEGRSCIGLLSRELFSDSLSMNFHVLPNRVISGIRDQLDFPVSPSMRSYSNGKFYYHHPYFSFGDKTGVIIDENFIPFDPEKKFDLDYIVLRGKSFVKLAQLEKMFEFEKIIIDNSFSVYKTNQWLDERNDGKIYSVAKSGAFEISL